MEAVLKIWLEASIAAHDFIERGFWEAKVAEMRDVYLPSADTYVYEVDGAVKGFVSLCDDTIAAIFVAPGAQGKGIGKQLIAKAKQLRRNLNLTVYKANQNSVEFYTRCGFVVEGEQIDEHTGQTELKMELRSSRSSRHGKAEG